MGYKHEPGGTSFLAQRFLVSYTEVLASFEHVEFH